MKAFLLSVFSILALLAGCTGTPEPQTTVEIPEHLQQIENLTAYPADTEPVYKLELVREQTFGDTDSTFFRSIVGVSVDERGNVLVTESDFSSFSTPLHLFQSDGSDQRLIGRIGSGPGEYRLLSDLVLTSGHLYLFASQARKINIYSSDDYTFERTFLIDDWEILKSENFNGYRLTSFYPLDNSGYIVVMAAPPAVTGTAGLEKLVTINEEGEAISDVLVELPDESSFTSIVDGQVGGQVRLPFMGHSLYDISESGFIYTAWTADFLIRRYDLQGNPLSAVYYPVKGETFELDSLRSSSQGGMFNPQFINTLENSVDLPETWPVLESMIVDDENRQWMETSLQNDIGTEWWLLDPEGELLAKFHTPEEQIIRDVRNGYLYAQESDEEGAPFIAKYRIHLTEN